MATYYVKTDGDNSLDGLSVANAWRDVDYAADQVIAGDTVYIAPGTYYDTQILMTVSGTSGNPITFYGDFTGEFTDSEPGFVVLVAVPGRYSHYFEGLTVYTLDLNGHEFLEFKQLHIVAEDEDRAVVSNTGTPQAHEGILFEDCTFPNQHTATQALVYFNYDVALTPATTGVTFRRCVFMGHEQVFFDVLRGELEEVNIKVKFESCFHSRGYVTLRTQGTGTFGAGGIEVRNCIFTAADWFGLERSGASSTVFPVRVSNCIFHTLNMDVVSFDLGTELIDEGGNYTGLTRGITTGFQNMKTEFFIMLGGIHDTLLWQEWGWSPFLPWEPMFFRGAGSEVHGVTVNLNHVNAPDFDLYGNPKQEGEGVVYAPFDGSSVGTDWDNPGNAIDNSWTTRASSNDTLGTATEDGGTKPLVVSGTSDLDNLDADALIEEVWLSGRLYFSANADQSVVQVKSGGELLLLASFQNQTPGVASFPSINQRLINAPAGGWTTAKLQALSVSFWEVLETVNTFTSVGVYGIGVSARVKTGLTGAGCVFARQHPGEENTIVSGASGSSMYFQGKGRYNITRGVIGNVTIKVDARYETGHTGTNPVLKATIVETGTEYTDTMTAGADTWEELSVSFNVVDPVGVVVELIAADTAYKKTFFDNLRVEEA